MIGTGVGCFYTPRFGEFSRLFEQLGATLNVGWFYVLLCNLFHVQDPFLDTPMLTCAHIGNQELL
jgi:hypothetical protein